MSGFKAKPLVFSAASLAIAFILSYVKLYHFPWGGSVTLCSMLFVSLIGWFYGPSVGLYSALIYGILQFFQGGSYVLTPMQVCLDYFAAFSALGVSGFFKDKKNGLLIGYIVGILLRGALNALGGYLYWMEYMPEEFPKALTAIYPIVYNYAYILIEGIITVAVISLTPVKKALNYVKSLSLTGQA
ncbi:MAG: energy-coupled thiamine transporter ThiT [Lachnospiraceae bacterium]|nr:energy-coupled thiamine transporter ThiT [Lachnospiraceae bacterium]